MSEAQGDFDRSVSDADFKKFGKVLTEATEAYEAAVERFNDALEAETDAIEERGIASGEFD